MQSETDRFDRTVRFALLFLRPDGGGAPYRFRDVTVRLLISRSWAASATGQTLLLSTANQLGRFVGEIQLGVPSIGLISPGEGSATDLYGEAERFARMSSPGVRVGHAHDREATPYPSIAVGANASSGFVVTASATGWRAEIGNPEARPPSGPIDGNPFGALIASTFATSEVFKEILRSAGSTRRSVLRRVPTFAFSGLNYGVGTEAVPDGRVTPGIEPRVTLVGAGAVGNAVGFALTRLSSMSPRLRVIDPDAIDESNLNRHLASSCRDIGTAKAEALARFVGAYGIRAIPSVARYQDVRGDLNRDDFASMVSTVDNDTARLALQSDLPRLLLHGATDGDVAVTSRHTFTEGACLGCLFYEQPTSYADSVAAETGIPAHEVARLLEEHGPLTEEHVKVIIGKNGPRFESLHGYVGKPFADVYAAQICGVIGVVVDERQVAPTVSFVSAFPGFVLAAELAKTWVPELARYRLKNYLALSLFAPEFRQLMVRPKDPRCRCFCADPIMQASYGRKWNSGS